MITLPSSGANELMEIDIRIRKVKGACAAAYSFHTVRSHKCIIYLCPSEDCPRGEFESTICLLNHELMHEILLSITGEKARIDWDNIVEGIGECLGNYC